MVRKLFAFLALWASMYRLHVDPCGSLVTYSWENTTPHSISGKIELDSLQQNDSPCYSLINLILFHSSLQL